MNLLVNSAHAMQAQPRGPPAARSPCSASLRADGRAGGRGAATTARAWRRATCPGCSSRSSRPRSRQGHGPGPEHLPHDRQKPRRQDRRSPARRGSGRRWRSTCRWRQPRRRWLPRGPARGPARRRCRAIGEGGGRATRRQPERRRRRRRRTAGRYAILYVDDEEQALKYFRKAFDKEYPRPHRPERRRGDGDPGEGARRDRRGAHRPPDARASTGVELLGGCAGLAGHRPDPGDRLLGHRQRRSTR